jgi:hypothetical protein
LFPELLLLNRIYLLSWEVSSGILNVDLVVDVNDAEALKFFVVSFARILLLLYKSRYFALLSYKLLEVR